MKSVENVRRKIAALMQKTVENGASESEATTAMEFAARMMKEHGITLEEIQKSGSEASNLFETQSVKCGKQLHVVDQLVANSIARYTDTKVWSDRSTSSIKFFGYSIDVELAVYIRDICKAAMEYEWNKYKVTVPDSAGHKKRIRTIFMKNMALRLSERLKEMKGENILKSSDGKALVIAKDNAVSREFKALSLRLKNSGRVTVNTSGSAAMAGRAAANNVHFNRAVHAGASSMKLIA